MLESIESDISKKCREYDKARFFVVINSQSGQNFP